VALADDLDLTSMTDTGMWIWAGALLLVSLALSYLVAVWWQRWRDREKTA